MPGPRPTSLLAATICALVLLTGCGTSPSGDPHGAATDTPTASSSSSPDSAEAARMAARMPRIQVRRVVRGLAHVWDTQSIGAFRRKQGATQLLLTERDAARVWLRDRSGLHQVGFPSSEVWVSGETGLMSLAVDPAFRRNHRFYTCQGGDTSSGHDVEVHAWRLQAKPLRAEDAGTLLSGIRATTGRHGGCRLLIARNGSMIVGTGDAADENNDENLEVLNAATLRLNRFTGAPWPTNPFINAPVATQRYIHTYGHRNVQGLAERSDGTLWSVEHGTDRDDEVNLLMPGGDYGWKAGGGYDESRPMTDQSLPGLQIAARWSSGYPTLATSGAAWVHGRGWGRLEGTLAVAALKGQRMLFLRFDREGRLVSVTTPPELRHYGRLRSVTSLPNGDLLVTTDNGSNDGVLRLSPR